MITSASRALALIVLLCVAVPLLAADPGVAIRDARAAIDARRYDEAVRVLRGAIPDASKLAEPQRTQALAALHFYTAIALSGNRDKAGASAELNQFFDLSPSTNKIDPAKFDSKFVAVFNETLASRQAVAGAPNFELSYPGFRSYESLMPTESAISEWTEGPELTILGTSKERQAWRELKDDAARREFIEEFWKKRDRTPETDVNETRNEFLRRVSFADQTFGDAQHRGAMTDRGRVFILLGAPQIVRQLPLSRRTGGGGIRSNTPGAAQNSDGYGNWKAIDAADKNVAIAAQDNTPLAKGKLERWVYGSRTLPVKIPEDSVSFSFITEEGYGANVLQREPLVNKVLIDAAQQ